MNKRSRVERNIAWIEKYCRIPEGKDIGQKVELRDWQRDWIEAIYGNPHGTRKAILSVGRKNAKTTFSAFLLLLHLAGPESVPSSQLYSAAQSKEQAAVIFALAAKIVRSSASLRQLIIIRDTKKELECPERGTLYRALSAEVKTSFGLSPVFIVHDELGQVRGPKSELFNALETATGAQSAPLSVIISTQAPTDNDLLSRLIDDARTGADPKTICKVYEAPKDADPFSEATIKLANPAYGDFQNADEVLGQAELARRLPSSEADYRNLILNQRVDASNPFIPKAVWQGCAAEPSAQFDTLEAYGGLDLSTAGDLTCLIRIAKNGGRYDVRSTFWLPQEGLRERSRRDRVPYDVWNSDGYLDVTPGNAVDYDFVAHHLWTLFQSTNLKRVAFDAWNFAHLKRSLLRAGFGEEQIEHHFVEFRQGFQSMSPALRTLEALILDRKLAHGDHPVLGFCAANAVVTRDPAGNRKLDKAKAHGRIDGMVALAMAASIAVEDSEKKQPEYQMFFV